MMLLFVPPVKYSVGQLITIRRGTEDEPPFVSATVPAFDAAPLKLDESPYTSMRMSCVITLLSAGEGVGASWSVKT